MSSQQDPYYGSDFSPIYHESDSESYLARRLSYLRQSQSPTATAGDQGGFTQPQPSVDPVGNLLEYHDTEVARATNPQFTLHLSGMQDMNHLIDYSRPGDFLPSTSSQDVGVRTDATYTHDTHYPLANLPFHDFPNFNYRQPLQAFTYTPQGPVYNYSGQSAAHDVYQMNSFYPVQDVQTAQASHVPSPAVDSYSSSQLFSLDRGGPVDRTDSRAARPTPDNIFLPDGVNTATVELPNMGIEQYSHAPVATAPANQMAPGPSRPPPSSPERKRLLPLSAADETARRVVPRHDRAQSVHSTTSDPNRRSYSRSDISGRGPVIPQDRYTTSSISSYNTPEQFPNSITFVLDNPEQIGIPITDILDKTDAFARIRDGAQSFNMGKKTFTLRVQWPGYRPWSKTIAALDWRKSRGPITRVKLAEAIATAIRDVVVKYRDEPCDPDYAQWNVGPNGIQLHQICLVELHHVSRGSWQPQLCLLEPRH